MNKVELFNTYKIRYVPYKENFRETLNTCYVNISKLLPLLFFYILYSFSYSFFIDDLRQNFGAKIYFLTGLITLFANNYIVLTYLRIDEPCFSGYKISRSFSFIIKQLKTSFFVMLNFLLRYIVLAVVLVIIGAFFTFIVNLPISPYFKDKLINIILFVVLCIFAQFFYSNYLAVTHDIDGQNAVRISLKVFNTHQIKTFVIFFIIIGMPILYKYLIDRNLFTIYIRFAYITADSTITFFLHCYIASFLKAAVVEK